MEKLAQLLRSKMFAAAMLVVVVFILIFAAFQIGVFVGERKASFSYQWGENYHRNFGGPPGGFFQQFLDHDYANPNGTYGKIVKITLPTITLSGSGATETEKIVRIGDDTVIRKLNSTISGGELTVGDTVVVVGESNAAGEVEAKLIRVFPQKSSFLMRGVTPGV